MAATVVTEPTAFPKAFESALNSGDLAAISALYDEHAVLHTQSGDVHAGEQAVRDEMQNLISLRAHITNTLRLTFRHDDVALIIVDYVLRLTLPDGKAVEQHGTATNVIQYNPDHGWKMIIANPQGTAPAD